MYLLMRLTYRSYTASYVELVWFSLSGAICELVPSIKILSDLLWTLPKLINVENHIFPKAQVTSQLPTPFSGTLFDALSLRVIHFIQSVSFRNHFPVG